MARTARPSRPASAADEEPAAGADADDPQWAAFLERVAAVEAQDPDEPGRWKGFFERLRARLGRSTIQPG